MKILGRLSFVAVASLFLFGYALKTGKCATHEQQLKNQREAIERTARLLAELELRIKSKSQPKEPTQQQAKTGLSRVGTKKDDDEDNENV